MKPKTTFQAAFVLSRGSILVWFAVALLAIGSCQKKAVTSGAGESDVGKTPSRPDVSHSGSANETDGNVNAVESQSEGSALPGSSWDLVAQHDLEAIHVAYESTEGEARNELMLRCISLLARTHTKAKLIELIAKLPPGVAKNSWIWAAMENGQGGFDASFFTALELLELPEERRNAAMGYAIRAKFTNSQEFLGAVDFVNQYQGLESDMLRGLEASLLRKYIGGLIQHQPAEVARDLLNLPDKFRVAGVESYAVHSANTSPEALLNFSDSLKGAPDLAKAGYAAGFEVLGEKSPSDAVQLLPRIPDGFRAAAIQSLTSGWLNQDSIAASQWVASLTAPADQVVAAEAVVQHLQNRKAPMDEIQPWQRLIDEVQAKPRN
jgi:hypothetical protein